MQRDSGDACRGSRGHGAHPKLLPAAANAGADGLQALGGLALKGRRGGWHRDTPGMFLILVIRARVWMRMAQRG